MKSFLLAVLLIACAVSADHCGGNCPGGKCPSCPCGTTPSHVDIPTVCKKYSWDQRCCQCVVKAESGGNAHAMNYNANGSFDVGVFQINNTNWGQCSGGKAPCDVDPNVACAIKVYIWGSHTWKLWSTAKGCGCA